MHIVYGGLELTFDPCVALKAAIGLLTKARIL